MVCHTRIKKSITKFETGEVKTDVVTKSITEAIDTPVKIKVRLKEFDIKGNLIRKEKSARIISVWNLGDLKSKSKEIFLS